MPARVLIGAALVAAVLAATPAAADDNAEANGLTVRAAQLADQAARTVRPGEAARLYREALDALDAVVAQHPQSDLAVQLATAGRIGRLVRADLDDAWAEARRSPCPEGDWVACTAGVIAEFPRDPSPGGVAMLLPAALLDLYAGRREEAGRFLELLRQGVPSLFSGEPPTGTRGEQFAKVIPIAQAGALVALLEGSEAAKPVLAALERDGSEYRLALATGALVAARAQNTRLAKDLIARSDALPQNEPPSDAAFLLPLARMNIAMAEALLGDAIAAEARVGEVGDEAWSLSASAIVAARLASSAPDVARRLLATGRDLLAKPLPAAGSGPSAAMLERARRGARSAAAAWMAVAEARLGDEGEARRMLADAGNIIPWSGGPVLYSTMLSALGAVAAAHAALGEGTAARIMLAQALTTVPPKADPNVIIALAALGAAWQYATAGQ